MSTKRQKIEEELINELEAFSSGWEHIHESVAEVVVKMMREAYFQGRKDEELHQTSSDSAYRSVFKTKTFNQWLEKRFIR